MPCETEIMGDRIEAGTFLMACGIAGGEIELEGRAARAPRDGRREARRDGDARVADAGRHLGVGAERLTAVDIATLPYPGFATDFMPMASRCSR